MRMRPVAGAALLAWLPSVRSAAEVRVDGTTGVVLGARREVSGSLFGITAFEGFPAVVADRDYRARLAALRAGCFRFGGGVGWFSLDVLMPTGYWTGPRARAIGQNGEGACWAPRETRAFAPGSTGSTWNSNPSPSGKSPLILTSVHEENALRVKVGSAPNNPKLALAFASIVFTWTE